MTPLFELAIGLLLIALLFILGVGSYAFTGSLWMSLAISLGVVVIPMIIATLYHALVQGSLTLARALTPDVDARLHSARTTIAHTIRDWLETTQALDDGWKGNIDIIPTRHRLSRSPRQRLRYGIRCRNTYSSAVTPPSINRRIHVDLHQPDLTPIQEICWRYLVRSMGEWTVQAPRYSAHAVLQAKVRLRASSSHAQVLTTDCAPQTL